MKKKCNCEFCTKHKRLKAAVKKRDVDTLIALATEFFEAWGMDSDDRDYYKVILDGSWPSSVEILEKALATAKKRRKEDPDLRASAERQGLKIDDTPATPIKMSSPIFVEVAFPSDLFTEQSGEA